MKHFPVSYVLWIGLTAAAPLMQADDWDHRTVVAFHQPVEIPRVVLGPGTYVVKLVDLASDRNVVEFLNERENHVFATVLAIPDYEPNLCQGPQLLHVRRAGRQRARSIEDLVLSWRPHGGEEFVYPKAETIATSAPPTNLTPRPAQPEPPRSQVQPAPASAPVIAQNITPVRPAPEQPVEIVQAKPAPTPAPAEQKKEPKTASTLPLIALSGMLSVTSGVVLRAFGNSL
jgi:hypothetical protein